MKPSTSEAARGPMRVAPRGGAWIETGAASLGGEHRRSLPVGGRGLKQADKRYDDCGWRRSPWGGVD